MGTGFNAVLADVVIASGDTKSRVIRATEEYADAASLNIQAPAALDAVAYTIEVSSKYRAPTDTYVDADFVTLNDGTSDIAPPAAGKGRAYTEIVGFQAFRIKQGGAGAGADRTFMVSKNFTTPE